MTLPSEEDDAQKLRAEIASLSRELDSLKKELDETRKSTTQYLQNVAHQLTAPLNAIKWNIEAIKDETVSIGRKKNLLSSIYSQGTILVHLIKNFSLMSNLEADHELGQYRNKPERVHPLRLSINLANDFEPQASLGDRRIEVKNLTYDAVFGNRELLVVKNLIAQALSNLLENAVKYSTAGTAIYVEATEITINNKAWKGIAVINHGLPISPSELQKLTDRGFRGSAARQKIPAGTGIGLYIADRIMDLHEGMIHCSAKGNNTQMTLLFPDKCIT